MRTIVFWTDERTERLKALWAEGLSGSQIAAKLGGTTRNAVIGRAFRLNLAKRKAPHAIQAANNRRAAAQKRIAKAAKPRPPRLPKMVNPKSGVLRSGTAAEHAKAAADFSRIQAEIAARQDVARVASIIDLEPHHCRWPIGEPTRGYCGDQKIPGASYCECHLARSRATTDQRHLHFIDSSPPWGPSTITELHETVAA